MSIFRMVATPLMAALIGYGTNYVAIKMLFRPRTAKYIGKFKIPFTPGIIPAQRNRIAHAIGTAIGHNLFTGSDVHSLIMNTPIADILVDEIMKRVNENAELPVRDVVLKFISQEKYESIKKDIHDFVCEKIMHSIERADIAKLIETEGVAMVREKLNGTFFGGLISDSMLQSFAAPLGDAIKEYVDKNGDDIISPIVTRELENIENMPLHIALEKLNVNREAVRAALDKLIASGGDYLKTLFEKLNIAGTVEKKVAGMDVIEVEKLVLSVMNRELNAIVNLGAFLGLILGIVMLLFK